MPHVHAFADFWRAGMNIDRGMAMDVDLDMGMVGADGCRGWG